MKKKVLNFFNNSITSPALHYKVKSIKQYFCKHDWNFLSKECIGDTLGWNMEPTPEYRETYGCLKCDAIGKIEYVMFAQTEKSFSLKKGLEWFLSKKLIPSLITIAVILAVSVIFYPELFGYWCQFWMLMTSTMIAMFILIGKEFGIWK